MKNLMITICLVCVVMLSGCGSSTKSVEQSSIKTKSSENQNIVKINPKKVFKKEDIDKMSLSDLFYFYKNPPEELVSKEYLEQKIKEILTNFSNFHELGNYWESLNKTVTIDNLKLMKMIEARMIELGPEYANQYSSTYVPLPVQKVFKNRSEINKQKNALEYAKRIEALKQKSDVHALISWYIAEEDKCPSDKKLCSTLKSEIINLLKVELPKCEDTNVLLAYSKSLWINSSIRIMIETRIEEIVGKPIYSSQKHGPFSLQFKRSINEDDSKVMY